MPQPPRNSTLGALACILVISPITRFPGFFELVAPVKGGIALVVLIVWWLDRRQRRTSLSPYAPLSQLNGLFIALLLWTVLTLLLSTAPAKGWGVLLAELTVLAFFYPFLDLATSGTERSWTLAWAFTGGAVAVAGLAILQYVVMQFGVLDFLVPLIIPQLDRDLIPAGGTLPLPAWGYRSWGTFHHPNLLGSYLPMALPMAIVLLLGSRQRHHRAVAWLAVLLIAAGIFCSGSRGGWLNAAIGLSVLLVFWAPHIPRRWILGAATAVAALGLIFQGQLSHYLRLDNVLSNRDIIWRHAWILIRERPWFGWGPGTFSRLYLERFDFPTGVERFTASRELASLGRVDLLDHWHAHNLFVHYAAEMGLFAVVLVGLLFAVYGRAFLRFKASSGDLGRSDLLAVGCSAAVAGNLVHSLLETTINFNYPALGIPFIFLFATGLASMGRSAQPAMQGHRKGP